MGVKPGSAEEMETDSSHIARVISKEKRIENGSKVHGRRAREDSEELYHQKYRLKATIGETNQTVHGESSTCERINPSQTNQKNLGEKNLNILRERRSESTDMEEERERRRSRSLMRLFSSSGASQATTKRLLSRGKCICPGLLCSSFHD